MVQVPARDAGLSRGIVILGMHRSGTSAITRGMQTLGADLGTNLLAERFDNPTGYWEDQSIIGLQDRLLERFGMSWETARLIPEEEWESGTLDLFVREARRYLRDHFLPLKLWAFKDPRTLRLLPMWQKVFQTLPCDHGYLLIIRNPLSVAASLYQRQAMPADQAYRLWLAYILPHLARLFGRQLAVVDYDLFMQEPIGALRRIARAFGLPPPDEAALAEYCAVFLRAEMRHNRFDEAALRASSDAPDVCKQAYFWLRQWAVGDAAASPVDHDGVWAGLVTQAETRLRGG